MSDPGLSCEILHQIEDALHRIERRFSVIVSPDDFLATDDGIDRLDAICMMLIAIGESLKTLTGLRAALFWQSTRQWTGKVPKVCGMLSPTTIST